MKRTKRSTLGIMLCHFKISRKVYCDTPPKNSYCMCRGLNLCEALRGVCPLISSLTFCGDFSSIFLFLFLAEYGTCNGNGYCLNGGTCYDHQEKGLRCQCPEGHGGTRCEKRCKFSFSFG